MEYRRDQASPIWAPAVNLYEHSSGYCMVVDLAGVSAESIDLRVEGDYLLLAGERPTPRPASPAEPACPPSQRRLLLMEIDHGPFARRVRLPQEVDSAAIEASYRNGFLWVRMPKRR